MRYTNSNRNYLSAEDYEWSIYTERVENPMSRREWDLRRNLAAFDAYVAGSNLRQERKLSQLTQEEAARMIGVQPSTLSTWENGEADITLRDACRLVALYRRFPGKRTDTDEIPSIGLVAHSMLDALDAMYLIGRRSNDD